MGQARLALCAENKQASTGEEKALATIYNGPHITTLGEQYGASIGQVSQR